MPEEVTTKARRSLGKIGPQAASLIQDTYAAQIELRADLHLLREMQIDLKRAMFERLTSAEAVAEGLKVLVNDQRREILSLTRSLEQAKDRAKHEHAASEAVSAELQFRLHLLESAAARPWWRRWIVAPVLGWVSNLFGALEDWHDAKAAK